MDFVSAAQRSVRGCWRLGWRCPEIFSPWRMRWRSPGPGRCGFPEIVWVENANHVIKLTDATRARLWSPVCIGIH